MSMSKSIFHSMWHITHVKLGPSGPSSGLLPARWVGESWFLKRHRTVEFFKLRKWSSHLVPLYWREDTHVYSWHLQYWQTHNYSVELLGELFLWGRHTQDVFIHENSLCEKKKLELLIRHEYLHTKFEYYAVKKQHFYFSDRVWVFQTFAVQTNAPTNHNCCGHYISPATTMADQLLVRLSAPSAIGPTRHKLSCRQHTTKYPWSATVFWDEASNCNTVLKCIKNRPRFPLSTRWNSLHPKPSQCPIRPLLLICFPVFL